MTYEANWDSIGTHQVPAWFDDAKLGIFIHWGLYSVPAWAPTKGTLADGIDTTTWMRENPYAEWYLNTMKIDGSPTQRHHRETYGEDFDYYDFAAAFNEGIRAWRPAEWAQLFRDAGARYVVLTTKHHDGFTLWPSTVENPHLPDGRRHAERDLVGDLSDAVREVGLKMGLYYSGGIDWSYAPVILASRDDWPVMFKETYTPEYTRYADAHWRELIERYQPDILWNDINYPRNSELQRIVADYYNRFPDGLINNRFQAPHTDFITPEYRQLEEISTQKWETCRGLGQSFGYNRLDGPQSVIPGDELIRLFVDVVSKNGNLLLNVGPTAEGGITDIQVDRLRTLGEWLATNGEAIFGSRPFERAEGVTNDGMEVRYTRKGDTVFAVIFGEPAGKQVTLEGYTADPGVRVTLLGHDGPLSASTGGADLRVGLPPALPSTVANVLAIASREPG